MALDHELTLPSSNKSWKKHWPRTFIFSYYLQCTHTLSLSHTHTYIMRFVCMHSLLFSPPLLNQWTSWINIPMWFTSIVKKRVLMHASLIQMWRYVCKEEKTQWRLNASQSSSVCWRWKHPPFSFVRLMENRRFPHSVHFPNCPWDIDRKSINLFPSNLQW